MNVARRSRQSGMLILITGMDLFWKVVYGSPSEHTHT